MSGIERAVRSVLLAYSEWLDGENLMVEPVGDDKRSHDDLVSEFLKAGESE